MSRQQDSEAMAPPLLLLKDIRLSFGSTPLLTGAGAARPAPEARRGSEPRKRLSFAEQHALKTSPARIEALNEEIRRLEHLLADPEFYARDRAGFAAAGAKLARAQAVLAACPRKRTRAN